MDFVQIVCLDFRSLYLFFSLFLINRNYQVCLNLESIYFVLPVASSSTSQIHLPAQSLTNSLSSMYVSQLHFLTSFSSTFLKPAISLLRLALILICLCSEVIMPSCFVVLLWCFILRLCCFFLL